MTAPEQESPSNIRRILGTFCIVLTCFLGKALPLPGLSWSDIPGEGTALQNYFEFENFTVGALGVGPILSAFFVVEFFAWLVPAWRKLRNGSIRGRAKLVRASLVVTFVYVFAQSYAIRTSLATIGPAFETSFIGILIAFSGWTSVLLLLAWWADRFSIVSGISAWLLAEIAFDLVKALVLGEDAASAPALLFLAAVAVLAVGIFLFGNLSVKERSERRGLAMPLLLAGVVPFNFLFSALGLPQTFEFMAEPGSLWAAWLEWLQQYPWWTTIVGFLAAWGFAKAFLAPKRVALLASVLKVDVQEDLSSFARARVYSSLIVLIVAVPTLFTWKNGIVVDVATPFTVCAVLFDAAASISFRKQHAACEIIYRCDRLQWACVIRDALLAQGIAVGLEGARHRSLLHFFAPYLPILIVVPRRDAEQARAILEPLTRNGLPRSGGVGGAEKA